MHEERLQRQGRMHLLSDKQEGASHISEERVLEMPSDVGVQFNLITPPAVDQSDDSDIQG